MYLGNESRNSPSTVSIGTILIQIECSNEVFQQIEKGLSSTVVSHLDLGLDECTPSLKCLKYRRLLTKKFMKGLSELMKIKRYLEMFGSTDS
uniref:Uncharacterized protein n=1 Tax=Wuchereria bancrofti TaxID=6293 RepID=A0A1I8EQC2_WUCBA